MFVLSCKSINVTVASHSTGPTTGQKIFCRNAWLLGALTGNTDSVGHGFYGSKSPARSAVPLISDSSRKNVLVDNELSRYCIGSTLAKYLNGYSYWEQVTPNSSTQQATYNTFMHHLIHCNVAYCKTNYSIKLRFGWSIQHSRNTLAITPHGTSIKLCWNITIS